MAAGFPAGLMCTPNDMPRASIPRPCGRVCGPPAGITVLTESQAGCAPYGEPPAQVGFDLQVAAQRAADLHLERAVPALPAGRRERVERAPLVQVDQAEALPGRAAEAHQRAQQLRAEA